MTDHHEERMKFTAIVTSVWTRDEIQALRADAYPLSFTLDREPPDDNKDWLDSLKGIAAVGDTCDHCGPAVPAVFRSRKLTLCGHCADRYFPTRRHYRDWRHFWDKP